MKRHWILLSSRCRGPLDMVIKIDALLEVCTPWIARFRPQPRRGTTKTASGEESVRPLVVAACRDDISQLKPCVEESWCSDAVSFGFALQPLPATRSDSRASSAHAAHANRAKTYLKEEAISGSRWVEVKIDMVLVDCYQFSTEMSSTVHTGKKTENCHEALKSLNRMCPKT